MTVINADGLIMGRLASKIAHRLLAGETISIVNAEKAIISGAKIATYEDYEHKRSLGSHEFGPFFPKRADRILKRSVRGMLPYKRARGKDALSRLRVYIGIPEEFENAELEVVEGTDIDRLSTAKYITIGELSRKMGSKF
jgi:large subunit ribosomal protein L13